MTVKSKYQEQLSYQHYILWSISKNCPLHQSDLHYLGKMKYILYFLLMCYALFFLLIYSHFRSFISHFFAQALFHKFNIFQTYFIHESLILLYNSYSHFIFSLTIKMHQSFHSCFRNIEFPHFDSHYITYYIIHWLVNQFKGSAYFMQFEFLYFRLIYLKTIHFFQSHLIKDFNRFRMLVPLFYHCLFYYFLNQLHHHHHHYCHLNHLSRINYHYHLKNLPHICFLIF